MAIVELSGIIVSHQFFAKPKIERLRTSITATSTRTSDCEKTKIILLRIPYLSFSLVAALRILSKFKVVFSQSDVSGHAKKNREFNNLK